jgi:hypothetical protein
MNIKLKNNGYEYTAHITRLDKQTTESHYDLFGEKVRYFVIIKCDCQNVIVNQMLPSGYFRTVKQIEFCLKQFKNINIDVELLGGVK